MTNRTHTLLSRCFVWFVCQILCNGPGTCFPICFVAFVFKVRQRKSVDARSQILRFLLRLSTAALTQ